MFLHRKDSSEYERSQDQRRSDLSDDESYDEEDEDQIGNLGNSRNQIDMMKKLYRQMKESEKSSHETPESRVSQLRQKYAMLDYSKHSIGLTKNFSKEDNLHSSSDSFKRNYRTQLRNRMRDIDDSNGSSMHFGEVFGGMYKDQSMSSNKNDSMPRSKLSKY